MENRSAKRQTLVVRLKDNPYFEEAHMILKDDTQKSSELEMVKEATRIIAAYQPPLKKEKRGAQRHHSSLFYFVFGMICSALFMAGGAMLSWMVG